jgi:hypothetical protein
LIKRWREAVIKCKGALDADFDATILSYHVETILIELAPESLTPLIGILENDSNGYVRESAIGVVNGIDLYRFRLRKTEIGRRAVEATRRALERDDLTPVYRRRENRENYWKEISERVFNDSAGGQNSWSFCAFALEKFYGIKTTEPVKRRYSMFPDANDEMRRFYTYLTDVDPFFPSWEYSYFGLTGDESFHPQFRRKMERYYAQWQKFKATRK